MLDRIRIWRNSAGIIHYELSAPDGTIEAHGAIPPEEWHDMRANVIRTYPPNISVSKLTDYLAVLGELV